MARRYAAFDPTSPYHLSSRCINQDWFALSMNDVWDLFSRHLYFMTHAFGVRVHLFVLMNNHFHLIATFPSDNMSESMAYLLRETSRELTKASHRINRTWGGRFFRSRLGSNHYFMHAYKYAYRNPIEAGICENVLDYPFSTLHGLLGAGKLLIPTVEDSLLFDSVEETVRWLNLAPSQESRQSVKRALRRSEFLLPRGKSKEKNSLEVQLY